MRARLIAQQSVTDPDGRPWAVGIRWLPRKPRWIGWGPRRKERKDKDLNWLDGADALNVLDFTDGPGPLAVIAAIAAAVFLIWFFVVPVAILAVDLIFLVLLVAVSLVSRVLFRRPWIVEATASGEQHQLPVVGYRASRQMVEDTARSIQLSGTLPSL